MSPDIAISTGILGNRPVLQALHLLKEAGFLDIQLVGVQGHFDFHDRAQVSAVRQELDRLGMNVTSMHAPYGGRSDLTLLNEPDRQAAVANIKAAADSLRALGGRTLVIHAGSEDDAAHSEAAERLSKGLRSVLELFQYCRTLGLTLAVEDMLPHLVGGRTADMQWLLSRIPDNIRVCLDTGHSFLSRDLIGRVNTFGPRLSTIHAHDNKGIYDDHLPPGEGDIPWPLLFDALVRAHFSGEIVLEVIDRPGEPDLLQRAWRSVPFLQSLYQPHAILPPAPADSR